MEQHRHEFCELVLVVGGKGVHVTGNFSQEVARGHVLVITGHRAHGYEKPQGLNLINILVRPDLLPRIERELRMLPGFHALFGEGARRRAYVSHMRLSVAECAQVEQWADHLEEETFQPKKAGRLLAEAYLTLIVGVLCRCYGRKNEARSKNPGRFGPLLSLMEKQIDKPMAVAELAKQAGMSERNFYRKFQKTVGLSPVDYLLKARIHHAKERLAYGSPDRRISEIAQECGFDDSNYFSRAFRKIVGMSPKEYRLRNLQLAD